MTVGATAPLAGPVTGSTVQVAFAGVPNASVAPLCRVAPSGIYGMPIMPAGTGKLVNGSSLRCELPAIQTEGNAFVELSFDNGTTWLQSSTTFSYVQPLDASPGRSLYNTGGPDAAAKGGSATPDARAEVLFVLTESPDGIDGPVMKGPATVTVRDSVSGKVLATANGAATDGTTRQLLEFPLASVPCASSVAPDASLSSRMTVDDAAAGLRCNTTLSVTATWAATGATAVRHVALLAGPWSAATSAMDYRGGAILVEDGRRLAPVGYFYGLHDPSFKVFAETAMLQNARTGDTVGMPYLSFFGAGSDPRPLGLSFLNASHNRGIKMMFDLGDVLEALNLNKANATRVDELWRLMEDVVTSVKDHPALLGWYINDDTVGRPMTLCRRVYLLVRRLDPYHTTFAAIAGSGNAWQYHSDATDHAAGAAGMTYDVGSYEMYIENDPAYEIPTIPLNWPMRWAPQWMTGFGGGGALGIETANRLQGLITAMYHGKGSLQWDYWGFSESAWPWAVSSARWANSVMAEIAPQLSSDNPNPRRELKPTSAGGGVVAVEYTDAGGCTALLVANTRRAPSTFSVRSEAAAAVGPSVVAPVLYERRHVTLTDGVLAESLDGYGTRVVRVNCSASGGGGGPGKGYGTDDYGRDDFATDDGGGGVDSANRVYNPSFEDFVTPGQAAGYRIVQTSCNTTSCQGDGIATQMTRVVDSTAARTLGHSLRVTGYVPGPGSPASARQETMTISDGQDKNPGGRFLVPGNGTHVSMEVYVRAPPPTAGWPGFVLSFVSDGFDAPCDFDLNAMGLEPWAWTRVACKRTMTAGRAVSLGFAGSGTVWLDDLSVEIEAPQE